MLKGSGSDTTDGCAIVIRRSRLRAPGQLRGASFWRSAKLPDGWPDPTTWLGQALAPSRGKAAWLGINQRPPT